MFRQQAAIFRGFVTKEYKKDTSSYKFMATLVYMDVTFFYSFVINPLKMATCCRNICRGL